MNLDHGIGPSVMPRPSYCGAAAAVSFCVLTLAGAAAGSFAITLHLIHRITRSRTP